jgi:glycosyltransferase involved in cell wall biosynthesis
MTSVPFFSVIVPTRDRSSQLAACMEALGKLEYPADRFEVIVVDDGGTASLAEIESVFRDKLSLSVIRQEPAGPAAARNTAARHAQGRFLAMTDDDCAPAPDWLSRLQESFERDPAKLYGGRTLNGLPLNRCAEASQIIIDVVYDLQPKLENFPQFFATNNFAVSAAGFREVGGFRESFRTSEDREFCDRWVHVGRELAHLPEAVVSHSHNLDFAALMRQHFNYGRGASRFHQLRAERGWGRFHFYGQFYFSLLQRCRSRRFPDSWLLAVLVACTQLAAAAGFVREVMARRPQTVPL